MRSVKLITPFLRTMFLSSLQVSMDETGRGVIVLSWQGVIKDEFDRFLVALVSAAVEKRERDEASVLN